MAVRIRKNVYSLPAGDTTLDWYNKAVKELLSRPTSNPTSWRYMAGIHGSPDTPPAGADPYWNVCQHGTWYFLPWHRAYIAMFEALLASE